MKVCALPYMCFCMLSNWIISFSASLLPSLRPQYGCTALQTAPGKRPQVALCVYISMLNKHVTPPPPVYFLSHFSFLLTSALHALSSSSPSTRLLKLCSLSIHLCRPGGPRDQSMDLMGLHVTEMRCRVWFFTFGCNMAADHCPWPHSALGVLYGNDEWRAKRWNWNCLYCK